MSKERAKRSKIWFMDKVELELIVSRSNTIREILKHFGLSNKGGNYKTLKKRLNSDGIDYSHIALGHGHNKGKTFNKEKTPLEEILVEHSTFSRNHLKKRLIKEGILENKCSICGLKNSWQQKELVMVLDHINGISDDNRIENLRLICPNCNSQTSTFAGRRFKKEYYCDECGAIKGKYSEKCRGCASKGFHKVPHPTKEQLASDIEQMSWVAIGKKYGVSDNAVRKWARKYGLVSS